MCVLTAIWPENCGFPQTFSPPLDSYYHVQHSSCLDLFPDLHFFFSFLSPPKAWVNSQSLSKVLKYGQVYKFSYYFFMLQLWSGVILFDHSHTYKQNDIWMLHIIQQTIVTRLWEKSTVYLKFFISCSHLYWHFNVSC